MNSISYVCNVHYVTRQSFMGQPAGDRLEDIGPVEVEWSV